ncbi:hypothetical protein VNO80_18063 [Phaseolus coccineus]|uniref:Uncharacterized protein n=1 Tax=Phaseolus coccineus TaxID=3886 RepID=A0AAN9QZ36_PHACN
MRQQSGFVSVNENVLLHLFENAVILHQKKGGNESCWAHVSYVVTVWRSPLYRTQHTGDRDRDLQSVEKENCESYRALVDDDATRPSYVEKLKLERP